MSKRVFIITDSFPPYNSTAAQRPSAWFNHLLDFDLFPIVITRNRSGQSKDYIEKQSKGEIHSLNLETDIMEVINYSDSNKVIKLIKRKFHSYFTYYKDSNTNVQQIAKYLEKMTINPSDIFVITVGPFYLLFICRYISEVLGCKVILDYRDDWSTSEIVMPYSTIMDSIIRKTTYRSTEKRLISFSAGIISVSDYYVSKLKSIAPVGIPAITLENGYSPGEFEYRPSQKHLSFVYVGSLYPKQDLEPFIRQLSVTSIRLKVEARFYFLGTPLSRSLRKKYLKYSNQFLEILVLPRLDKKEAMEFQCSCHYGIMTRHSNTVGVPSSKLYSYLGVKQPVVLYPSDDDVIESTLLKAELGVIKYSDEELCSWLEVIMLKGNDNHRIELSDNAALTIKSYSRKEQTGKLANFISRISEM